jgi:hypothetical protein
LVVRGVGDAHSVGEFGHGLTGKECEEENADKTRDRVTTEPIETMGIFRMYAGPDGKSHLEEQSLAEHPLLTKPQAAKLIVFAEQPAGTLLDWHPAPRRQYVIVVSGQLEIGLGDGTYDTVCWSGSRNNRNDSAGLAGLRPSKNHWSCNADEATEPTQRAGLKRRAAELSPKPK